MFRWLKKLFKKRTIKLEAHILDKENNKMIKTTVMKFDEPNHNGRVYPSDSFNDNQMWLRMQMNSAPKNDICNCDECASKIKCDVSGFRNGSIKNRY